MRRVLEPADLAAMNALGEMRARLAAIQRDAVALKPGFESGALDCALVLMDPEPYILPADVSGSHPNLSILANRVGQTWNALIGAQSAYDTACAARWAAHARSRRKRPRLNR